MPPTALHCLVPLRRRLTCLPRSGKVLAEGPGDIQDGWWKPGGRVDRLSVSGSSSIHPKMPPPDPGRRPQGER